MIKLEDKLYTSTEVADILGVSLRSVYRYIEENKLHAEVKTATGRHRFTRQDILNFLYPEGVKEEESDSSEKISRDEGKKQAPVVQVKVEAEMPTSESDAEQHQNQATQESQEAPEVQEETNETQDTSEDDEENVDWLSKFREAAKKFQDEEPKQEAPAEGITGLGQTASEPTAEPETEDQISVEEDTTGTMNYYKSGLGGLKEIAQNIDKSARNAQLPYAFTLNAGLSLHSPIKPFSLLHAYVRPVDLEFFEKSLQLTGADEDSAQICVIVSDDVSVFSESEELHGLFVVGKSRLAEDISSFGDDSLKEESAGLLE